LRNLFSVGPNTHRAAFPLQVIESVRCLSCGALYSKLAAGGTAATNPGCPDCGYLGWRSLNDEAVPLQTRFASGHPQTRLA
jgi:predicted  nucleic acid-binding Zn-ribbon protein